MIDRHCHAEDVILDDGDDDAAASAEALAGVCMSVRKDHNAARQHACTIHG